MEKLTGRLYLSDINKSAIQTDMKTGKKYIWVDVIQRRSAGKYGETHAITNWHSGKTTYLADLTPRTVNMPAGVGGQAAAQAPVAATAEAAEDGDLPF